MDLQKGDRFRIGTRGSDLALAQAHELKDRILKAHPDHAFSIEIEVISTKGDRVLDRPLSEIGGKGLFTEEIEEQLSNGQIDMAVHSSKDMPTVLPEGLELSCYLPREGVADAFICRSAKTFDALPQGAVIGSASLRRKALLMRSRPDLKVINFRGNVQTRLRKLDAGDVDATLLAEAGLRRLGMGEVIASLLPIDDFPPAPGQGAICIETRMGDDRLNALLSPINDPDTMTALVAERAFLRALDGSCRTPLAAHAVIDEGAISFHGMILTPDGDQAHELRTSGTTSDAAAMGTEIAEKLKVEAGPGFFETWV